MSSRNKYPLDPLVRVREARVDGATRAVAAATRKAEDARAARIAAEASRARAAEAARAARESEREVLESGGLTAADLARADAWETRVQGEDQRLFGAVSRAAEAEAAAIAEEAAARAALAGDKADADVVAKDRAAWLDVARRRAEAAEEEDAAEAWRRGE